VTKIAGVLADCVDRNADTVIQTSTGGSDVLAYDADECVRWTVPLSGDDAIPRSLAIDTGDEDAPHGYPWVGTFNDREEGSNRTGRAFKLSPVDGSVLLSVALPIQPYGAITDGARRVWFTAWGEDALVSVATDDGAVGRAVAKTEPFGCDQTYGIAVDANGRIWTGGWSCECAYRYDPDDDSWTTIDLRGRGNTRGVTPDGEGYVWVAHSTSPGTITRVPIDLPGPLVSTSQTELVTLEGDASGTVGVGADFERHLWIVNRDSSTVTRMNLADREQEQYQTGLTPYTYSDFTGFQLSRTVTPEGHYDQDFEGCPPGNVEDPNVTGWGDLTWEADVPPSTSLSFVIRTADTRLGLDAAEGVTVATVPDSVPPVNVTAALEAEGVAPGQYLRITVLFISQDGVSRPILTRLSVTWECPDVIG
jgi:sugar lactone lactonase YvrE